MPASVSMKKTSPSSQQEVPLEGHLAEFRQALKDEIAVIEKNGHSTTILKNGERIQNSNDDCWYRFFVDYMPVMPADTPCKLTIGKDTYEVTVVSCTDDYIIVSSPSPLPDALGYVKMENGSTVLMELLIRRIENNAKKANPAGMRMLQKPSETATIFHRIFNSSFDQLTLHPNNTANQRNAILQAVSNNITYIWGPPGTGKTSVIGQIIHNLLKQQRSVLLVSHTNTAVDGAIRKTGDILNDHPEEVFVSYPLLRIGICTKSIPKEASLEHHVHELGRDIEIQLDELINEKKQLLAQIQQLQIICMKINWLTDNKLNEIRHTHQMIDKLLEDCRLLEDKVSHLQSRYQVLRNQYPNYTEYNACFQRKTALENQYDTYTSQEKAIKGIIEKLKKDILHYQNEIIKYQEKNKLITEIQSSTSEETLKGQLQEQQQALTGLQEQLSSLREEKSALSAQVKKYNESNAFFKLFSNRKLIVQWKNRISEIDILIDQIESALKERNDALHNIKEELCSLQLKIEQMNAITISESMPQCKIRIATAERAIENFQMKLSSLQVKMKDLLSELSLCREAFAKAQEAFNFVEHARADLEASQNSLHDNQRELQNRQNHLSQLLEEEKKNCSSFGIEPDETDLSKSLFVIWENLHAEYGTHNIAVYQNEEYQMHEYLTELNTEISTLEQKKNELERQAILNAPVIGATLAKSYLSDILQSRSFDTVILDEASMASIPALWCASQLAERNLVIVGDFLQLSPIVIAKNSLMAKKWLGTDIFRINGIEERAKRGNVVPDNLVILSQQFRMEKEIAEIANRYYGKYHSLESNDHSKLRMEERNEFYTWYTDSRQNHCVHLIDTESLGAWVTGVPQGSGHSRYNAFSAAVDVELAFKLIEKKLETRQHAEAPVVLIVVPYRPQVKIIERYIEAHYHARGLEDLEWIKVGTIHRFQGSEADIVIFDLVLDEPHWKANLFMPDEEINQGLEQMFNVAVTRAKFKLFMVGNFSFCMKKAKQNALGSLLGYLINEQHLKCIDAKSLFPDITYALPHAYLENDILNHELLACKGEHFYEYLYADIQKARHRIILFSPFITEKRLSQLLPYFCDAVNRHVQIIVITKALADHKESEKAAYMKCIQILNDDGIHVIYKKNMHEKLIFIDEDILWIGSLNALSFTGATGEIMQRSKSKSVFEQQAKNIDLEHMLTGVEQPQEERCPICGSKLMICDAADGGFYWACENKDYTRNPSQPYPYDGMLRCGKCNGEFRFEMKNQPRWVCQSNSKHYQNIRKNDMMLPRMLELIPRKDRKRVQDYFMNGQQTLFDMIDSDDSIHIPANHINSNGSPSKKISSNTQSAKPSQNSVSTHAVRSASSNTRTVLQITDSGKIIKEYPSIAAAVQETGINSKSIRNAARGIQTHAGSYRWRYKD